MRSNNSRRGKTIGNQNKSRNRESKGCTQMPGWNLPTAAIMEAARYLDAHGADYVETDGPNAIADFVTDRNRAVNCEAHVRYCVGCVETRLHWPGNGVVRLYVHDM